MVILLAPAGLFIEEVFQYQKKWFGYLLSEDNASFARFVEITKFYPGGCDWRLLDGQKEKIISKHYAEKQRKK